jgi:hypothetical protein
MPGCDDEITFVKPAVSSDTQPSHVYDFEKLKVHPNPVKKSFEVEFPKNYQGKFRIQITDLIGTTYNISETTLKGEGSVVGIDISKLSLKAGIYFLKVTSDNKRTDLIKLVVL